MASERLIDVSKAAFVHPSALLFGKLTLGDGASIWPYVVARAEMHAITIGDYTNIQDFTMIHVGYDTPTVIGAYCSITHRATLHGCTIGDYCLVGIGATIMDGAVIGENSIVGEHALVRPGFVAPPNSIVAGVPARVVRSQDNLAANRMNALFYHENALAYARGNFRVGEDPALAQKLAAQVKAISSG
jgi:carbonic anhydrase/acetyltransferase-like protein (isoleucine patch superfamily)